MKLKIAKWIGMSSGSAASLKQTQVKARATLLNQITNNFSNDAGELESVAGARTGNQHLRMLRVLIDQEVAVGCVRVHADGATAQVPAELRQKGAHEMFHGFDFARGDFARDFVRAGHFSFVVASDLDALAQIGKAVEKLFRRIFPDMNRAAIWLENFCITRFKPK